MTFLIVVRTVRRIDPATGEMVPLSPSASNSFGSNLSLTVSESDGKPNFPKQVFSLY